MRFVGGASLLAAPLITSMIIGILVPFTLLHALFLCLFLIFPRIKMAPKKLLFKPIILKIFAREGRDSPGT